jgi:hypothetical protein
MWIQDGLTHLATTGSSAVAGWMAGGNGSKQSSATAAAAAAAAAASPSAAAPTAEVASASKAGASAAEHEHVHSTAKGAGVAPGDGSNAAPEASRTAGRGAESGHPSGNSPPEAAAASKSPKPGKTSRRQDAAQAAADSAASGVAGAPTVTTAGAQDATSSAPSTSAISSGLASPLKGSRAMHGAQGTKAEGVSSRPGLLVHASPRDDAVIDAGDDATPTLTVPSGDPGPQSTAAPGVVLRGPSSRVLAVQPGSPSTGEGEGLSFGTPSPRARGYSNAIAPGTDAGGVLVGSGVGTLRRPPLRRDGSQASSIAAHITSPKYGGAHAAAESALGRAPNPTPPSRNTEAASRGTGVPPAVGSASTTALRGRNKYASASGQPAATAAPRGLATGAAPASGSSAGRGFHQPLSPSAPEGQPQRPGAASIISASSQGLRTRRTIRPANGSPAGSSATSGTARSSPRFAGSQAVLDEAKEEEEESPRGVQSTRTLGGVRGARPVPLGTAGHSVSVGRGGGLLAAVGLG